VLKGHRCSDPQDSAKAAGFGAGPISVYAVEPLGILQADPITKVLRPSTREACMYWNRVGCNMLFDFEFAIYSSQTHLQLRDYRAMLVSWLECKTSNAII
jgi:hypothetical protein